MNAVRQPSKTNLRAFFSSIAAPPPITTVPAEPKGKNKGRGRAKPQPKAKPYKKKKLLERFVKRFG